jgi:intracellular septation protein
MNLKTLIHFIRIIIKSLFEFIPILSFFLTYEFTKGNFFSSTFVMMLTTIIYTFYTFHKEKRIPYLAFFISLETTFFGGLTLFLKDPVYVQMRDSFYDIVLGGVILVTGYLNKPIIKKFFGHIFNLEDILWKKLSYQWSGFLLTFGVTNEYVRRHFTEDVWVNYKFVVFSVTVTFGLYLFWKYKKSVKNLELV